MGGAASRQSSDQHVALLRGLNVGGKNRLAMKDLAAVFAEAGCRDVRTYIQSGNVVYSASRRVADKVPEFVRASIRERFGITTPVVTRSAAEFRQAVERVPWKDDADDGIVHVMFLRDAPPPEAVAGLDPDRSPGDRFEVVGRDVYLRLPNGVAGTKLTNAYFDAKLDTVSTGRNWRTVLKLLAMSSEGG
jgi:uncharacterized protein (DUF1697 family)